MIKDQSIFDNTAIIIRSCEERTEGLCEHAVKQQGFNEIHFIKNVAPFSKALKKGYELAIEINKPYSIFIDADVIVTPHSLTGMVYAFDTLPESTFFMNPLVWDYMFNEINQGGPHLFRTKHLKKAVDIIVSEKFTMRPEASTANKMHQNGYHIVPYNMVAGVHNSEQFNRDIFRQMQNKYFREPKKREERLEYWSKPIPDFEIAKLAFEDSKTHKELSLDYKEMAERFAKLNINEKPALESENYGSIYDTLMNEFAEASNIEFSMYPFVTRKLLIDLCKKKFKFW